MPITNSVDDGVTQCLDTSCERGAVLTAIRVGAWDAFGGGPLPWHLAHALLLTGVATLFARFVIKAHGEEQALLPAGADKYHEAIEKLDGGFYRTTMDGRFLLVNAQFVTMLGYASADELMHAPTSALYAAESGRERLLAELRAEGHVYRKECLLVKKDGTPLLVTEDARVPGHTITGVIVAVNQTLDRNIITICATCNKMRDGGPADGVWVNPPVYIHAHLADIGNPSRDVVFSHGMCPSCADEFMAEEVMADARAGHERAA